MFLLRRAKGLMILHCGVQVFLSAAFYALWTQLFPIATFHGKFGLSNYFVYGAVICAVLILEGLRNGNQLNLLQMNLNRAIGRALRQISFIAFGVMLFLVAAKDGTISRLFFFSLIPGMFILLSLSNRYLPAYLAGFIFRTAPRQRTLLVGMPGQACLLQGWLEQKRGYGIDVVGLLCNEVKAGNRVGTFPVVGKTEELEERVKSMNVRQIILLDAIPSTASLTWYLTVCDQLGIRLTVFSNFGQSLGRRIRITEDEGFQFLSFRNEPLECPWNRIMKRFIDIVVSVPVVFLILPPLALTVKLIQSIQSPGSLFFNQSRTGANGRVFAIRKFRTMRTGGFNQSKQATPHDDRVYAFGRWLRRTSLDELPQFINVMLGEMSVVGPRPHMPSHDEQFELAAFGYRLRNFVKPGITGLAQISGYRGETRTNEDVIKRVEKDLDYAENWSPMLDVIIIVKTIFHVLSPLSSSY